MHHQLRQPSSLGLNRTRSVGRAFTFFAPSQKQDGTSLVEIGPRLVLAPIRIFSGSFGGATLYHDAALVLPNEERAMARRDVGSKYERRKESQEQRREHISANPIPEDELADTFRDDGGYDV